MLALVTGIVGNWRLVMGGLAALGVVAGGLWLTHVIEREGALEESNRNLRATAAQDAAAAARTRGDAEEAMAAVRAQLDAERRRTASTMAALRLVDHARPAPATYRKGTCDEDAVAPLGGAGDAAYRCLLDPAGCARDPGGAGTRPLAAH